MKRRSTPTSSCQAGKVEGTAAPEPRAGKGLGGRRAAPLGRASVPTTTQRSPSHHLLSQHGRGRKGTGRWGQAGMHAGCQSHTHRDARWKHREQSPQSTGSSKKDNSERRVGKRGRGLLWGGALEQLDPPHLNTRDQSRQNRAQAAVCEVPEDSDRPPQAPDASLLVPGASPARTSSRQTWWTPSE